MPGAAGFELGHLQQFERKIFNWRKKIRTENDVNQLEGDVDALNELTNALLTLVHRFKSSSHLSTDGGEATSKSLCEVTSLLANCTHLKLTFSLALKNVKVIHPCADVLDVPSLRSGEPKLSKTLLRLFANIVLLRECAFEFLQSRNGMNAVIQMIALVPASSQELENGGLLDQAMRFVRNFNGQGNAFARELAKKGAVFAIGRLICEVWALPELQGRMSILEKSLLTLASFRWKTNMILTDSRFFRQVIESECLSPMVGLVSSPDKNVADGFPSASVKALVENLVLFCDQSDLRVDLCKAGFVQFAVDCYEARNDTLPIDESLEVLCKFCGDAYSRNWLRDNGVLGKLMQVLSAVPPLSDSACQLLRAFQAFQYDTSSSRFLYSSPVFITALLSNLRAFVEKYPCSHHVSDYFDPDSPSYRDTLEDSGYEPEPKRPRTTPYFPLHKTTFSSPDYCSGGSSPGSSWSPSASFAAPLSPGSSSSATSFGRKSPLSEIMDLGGPAQNMSNPAGPSPRQSGRHSVGTSSHKAQASAAAKNVLNILSWLSHYDDDVYCQMLVQQTDTVDLVLSYIAKVCEPDPVAGRMLKRLAKNPRLLEPLLIGKKFHILVRTALCHSSFSTGCSRCSKRCKVGHQILYSFMTIVDTPIGFSLIMRSINSTDPLVRAEALNTAAFLVKSHGNKVRIFRDMKSLDVLMNDLDNALALPSVTQHASDLVQALLALINNASVNAPTTAISYDAFGGMECRYTRPSTFSHTRAIDVELSPNNVISVDRVVLAQGSEIYRAMLSTTGDYRETALRRLRTVDMGVSGESFEAFVHYLYGCRSCLVFGRLNATHCIDLLDLAKRHFIPALANFVMDTLLVDKLTAEAVPQLCFAGSILEFASMIDIALSYFLTSVQQGEMVSLLHRLRQHPEEYTAFANMLADFVQRKY